jgi:hypothetical protein
LELSEIYEDQISRIPTLASIPDLRAEYQHQLIDATKELNSIQIPSTKLPETDSSLFDRLEAKKAAIAQQREDLHARHVHAQKQAENRHLRTISAMDFLPEKLRPSLDRTKLQLFQMKICELERTLSELRSSRACPPPTFSEFEILERELRHELEILTNDANRRIDERRHEIDNERAAALEQMKDIVGRINHVKGASKTYMENCRSDLTDARTKVRAELQEIRADLARSEKEIRETHESEMSRRRIYHQAAVLLARDKCRQAGAENAKPLAEIETESVLQRAAADMDARLAEMTRRRDEVAAELEGRVRALKERFAMVQMDCEENSSRSEDIDLIERLEKTLELKTTHLRELTHDIQEYKRQIVSQEGVYNMRFGATPNVAVLRTQTAQVGRGRTKTSKSQIQRPFSAATGTRPTTAVRNRQNSEHGIQTQRSLEELYG